MVNFYENYGPYVDLVKNHEITIDLSKDINYENYNYHFNGILNIMRDGIEDPEVQGLKIHIIFADGNKVTLTLTDYFFNLSFWTFPIYAGSPVTPEYFIDTRKGITKKTIRNFFNICIDEHVRDIPPIYLNNMIDESISKFRFIDEFSMYLSNTLNFKDTLDLMKEYPEFNAAIHADLTGVPIEDVKDAGMKYARTQIDYIKNNDHCLRDSFIAKEAINEKQFKEVSASIGTKPDGHGGIFPYIINRSFINGGVQDPEAYVIDSSVGRTAQILSKMNTGTSGDFARLLELNNADTFFHENENFSCNTRNYISVYIENHEWLNLYDKRYYKFVEDGPEYCLSADRDSHLVGRTLLFRSPMTCASYARGYGICRKCYGDMYYINRDINPGIIAAESLSSKLTQKLLSAKHLLESAIVEMNWNPEFRDFFEVNLNILSIYEDAEFEGYYLKLDSSMISNDDDMDDNDDGIDYDEYVPSFSIIYPDGTEVNMHTADEDNIYITEDLNRILKSKKAKDKNDNGIYTVALEDIKGVPIFTVRIMNKELQRTLENIKHLINRSKDASDMTKDTIVKKLIDTSLEGGISMRAIHYETILSNQIRDANELFEMPHWETKNVPYRIIPLNQSLTNSPSITTTFEYQRIANTLVSPLSTKKHKASSFDLHFMEQPQHFVINREMISDAYHSTEDDAPVKNLKDGIIFVDKSKANEE